MYHNNNNFIIHYFCKVELKNLENLENVEIDKLKFLILLFLRNYYL